MAREACPSGRYDGSATNHQTHKGQTMNQKRNDSEPLCFAEMPPHPSTTAPDYLTFVFDNDNDGDGCAIFPEQTAMPTNRTHAEACLDLEYAVRLHALHARLYRRLS